LVRIVQTSGGRISYREVGSIGPTVLCLHEGSPGADGWSSFGPPAQALSDRFRVIVPDQPGFGDSPTGPESAEGYQPTCARTMAELLGALGIRRAHVVGNSLGGGVALMMALDHPELIDRLVLIGPWTSGVGGARSALPPGVQLLLEYYPGPSVEKMRALVEALVYDTGAPDDEAVEARYQASLVPEHENGFLQTLRSPAVEQSRLAELENDVLLLWGRDDQFCPTEDAIRYLELLPSSTLVVFPRCGHSVHLERPDDFRAQVCSFLET